MNEPVDVEARFHPDGRVEPRAFLWRGRRYLVTALGRTWEEGDERRFLVMTPGDQVFELAYRPAEAAWRLRRTPESFGPRPI